MKIRNLHSPIDISIPIRFNGDQPNVYGVEPATSKPCEYGELVGDTRRGGSVNFEEYRFIPHCNGTHTECVGHITDERISVRDCLKDILTEAILISVEPESAIGSVESYPYAIEETDLFITMNELKSRFSESFNHHGSPTTDHGVSSLIIRTLPNEDSKLTRDYDKPVPPFFSNEAMKFIFESGFRHLLVDLPSIDRLYDGGKLSNHRIFWNVPNGSKKTGVETRIDSTITELIYVPNEVEDGRYILNLQIAPFESDAAPSRPLLLSK